MADEKRTTEPAGKVEVLGVKNTSKKTEEKPVEEVEVVPAEEAPIPEDTAVRPKSRKGLGIWFDIVSILLVAALIISVFFTFFFRFSSVEGVSMEPTLHSGDWVVLKQWKVKPSYGDIVVISQPNDANINIIKRVIATEGQVIDIDDTNGNVYVDGKLLHETYIKNPTTDTPDQTFPLRVPDGYCFVMGDNRQNSEDSRYYDVGFIRNDYILGEAVLAGTSDGMKSLQFKG